MKGEKRRRAAGGSSLVRGAVRRPVAWGLVGAALAGVFLGAAGTVGRRTGGPVPARLLAAAQAEGRTVVVATFNIRHALGVEGRLDIRRVAETVAGLRPDLVGLQEVDVFQLRSGLVNQPEWLARHLGYHVYFGPALRRGVGFYGNALLSRYPILAVRTETLPADAEPRSAIVARVGLPAGTVTVVVTHLGLAAGERRRQVAALEAILRREEPPFLLLGDWNDAAPVWSPDLGLRAADAGGEVKGEGGGAVPGGGPAPPPAATFRWGGLAGDRIYVGRGWRVLRGGVAREGSSDHFPVWVELQAVGLWG